MTNSSLIRRCIAHLCVGVLVSAGLCAATASATLASDNLALTAEVTASGEENPNFPATKAADGIWAPTEGRRADGGIPPGTHNHPDSSRWSANAGQGPWWIQYEFAAKSRIDSVIAEWGNTYATNYYIETSDDGQQWTKIIEGLSATAKTQKVTTEINAVEAKYMRLTVTQKSQNYPLSLWELAVNGEHVESPPSPITQDPVGITPKPLSSSVATDDLPFVFQANTCVTLSHDDLLPAVNILREALAVPYGIGLPVAENCAVQFILDPQLTAQKGQQKEAYKLEVTDRGIALNAASVRGAIWGTQSLLQLIGPWTYAAARVATPATVPALTILDAPRYAWRGVMLDPSRSFIPVNEVKNYIDLMSASKLNVLHMHVSEDQGWRLEISNEGKAPDDTINYDNLTAISGQTSYMAGKSDKAPEAGRTGFYTRSDYTEIIQYAASRGIAVVTEIDGPGHMIGALHAIPELNTEGASPKPPTGENTVPPFDESTYASSTLDVNSETTYTFLQHVISDIARLTHHALAGIANVSLREEVTLPYFHIGGDEAGSGGDGYKNFISRVSQFAVDQNYIPMVWNDALTKAPDELAEGSVVQHWLGDTTGFSSFVTNKGGKVLMSTIDRTYYPQRPGSDVNGPTWACPTTGCTLNRWYNWNPTASAGVNESSVLGVESALWQEHVRTEHDAQFLMFPRTFALAEVAWTQDNAKNYDDFRSRLSSLGLNLINREATFRLSATDDPDGVAWTGSYVPLVLGSGATLSADTPLNIGLLALPGVTDAELASLPLAGIFTDAQGIEHTLVLSYQMDTGFRYTDEGRTTGRQMNSVIKVSARLANTPACMTDPESAVTAGTSGGIAVSGTIPAGSDGRRPSFTLDSANGRNTGVAMSVPVCEEDEPKVSDEIPDSDKPDENGNTDNGDAPAEPENPDTGHTPTEPDNPQVRALSLTHATATVEGHAVGQDVIPGTEVTVTAAQAPEGKEFAGWDVRGVMLSAQQLLLPRITFTMPDDDISLVATYKDSAKSITTPSPTPTPTPTPHPDAPQSGNQENGQQPENTRGEKPQADQQQSNMAPDDIQLQQQLTAPQGQQSPQNGTVNVKKTAGKQLPQTGSETRIAVFTALTLIGTGAVAVVSSRRARKRA